MTDLSSCLVQSQMMSQLLLADGTGRVNLVSQNEEGNLGELLDGQESVELGFRLRETLEIGAVDQENDTIDFWEVIAPEAAGYQESTSVHQWICKIASSRTLLMSTKIIGSELHVANGQFFGS